MPCHDYADSALEKWLRARHMTTNNFVKLIGCARQTVWKVKKGVPICALYAKKIIEVTKGEVVPIVDLKNFKAKL